jgi:hypothetical protein
MTTSEKIGTIALPAQQQTEHYEYAAWFRTYDCLEQISDVYLTRSPEGRPQMIHYGMTGVCVDAHLASYFCGNRISNDDPAGRAAIGKPGTFSRSIYAYQLPANLKLDAGYEWLSDESKWDREMADRKLREAIKYHTNIDRLAREININFLRKNGSPELVSQVTGL